MFKYIDPAGFEIVRNYFIKYEAWAVSIAGFTPIPYKVFTISAGFLRADFTVFFIASVFSRGARFFLVSLMIFHYGPSIRSFIDKYFNVLTFVFMVLLLGGFFVRDTSFNFSLFRIRAYSSLFSSSGCDFSAASLASMCLGLTATIVSSSPVSG